ncbi:hypothetical protein Tco_1389313, partial [Tanacetum coccineum]
MKTEVLQVFCGLCILRYVHPAVCVTEVRVTEVCDTEVCVTEVYDTEVCDPEVCDTEVLSNEDLKGTRTEHGFKWAFISLFGEDVETFTSTIFLYVDQLEKQLDKDEFQEDDSMDAFWVLNRQCQQFIYSQFSLDYDSQMTNKSFSAYTRIKAKDFRDTLLKHMSFVKKSIAERARHQRHYDKRVNKGQLLTQECKVDMGVDSVVTKSSGTKLKKHDTSSRSGNDTHAEDTDIKPVNEKEPMAEVQLTTQHNVLANEKQHTRQSKSIYDTYLLEKVDSNIIPDSTNMSNRGGEIDQIAEKCQVTSPLLDPLTQPNTSEQSYQSLESKNISLKKIVAQFQKDFSRMEAYCVNLELKYQNQALEFKKHGPTLNETSNKAKRLKWKT